MKRVYFILIILIAFLETTAQDKVDFLRTKVDGNRNIVDARLRLSHSLNIPRGASWSLNGAKDSIGYVMFNTTLQRFGVYHGSGVWKAYATIDEIELLLDGKVDTIHGKGLSTEDYTTAEKSKLAGIAAGAEVNVNADWSAVSGDAMILNKPTFVATESDPVFLAQKGAVNGVATLNSSGKIPNAQIPALALVDTYVAASQAAMLALSSAEQGDVAIRTDLSKTFILTDNNYSTLASWKELLSPVIPAETDPIWGASPSAGITSTNITNWNTAYGWGNHALAGYALATSLGNYLPLTGGTLSGPLNGTIATFNSSKLKLGADGSYGTSYSTISFGGTLSNGDNRIFAGNDLSDDIYIAAGTGKSVKIWANGTSSDVATFSLSGTTLSAPLIAGLGNFSSSIGIGSTLTPSDKLHIFGPDSYSGGIRVGYGPSYLDYYFRIGYVSGNAINFSLTDAGTTVTPLTLSYSGGTATFSSLIGPGDRFVVTNSLGSLITASIGPGLSLSGGVLSATGGSAGTVTGSGTAGYITKWNSASDIGNSIISESGSDITIAGDITATDLAGATGTFYSGAITLGNDGSYSGSFSTIGFNGSRSNGSNRIFASIDGSDGIYIAAATGRSIFFRPNGGTSDIVVINSSGISASSFSGPGTGLTGTAASLTAGAANAVAWTNVSSRPTALSQFSNDLIYSWALASVKPSYSWSEITSRPTALSSFTNDLGNYGGWITGINSSMVTTALGYTPANSTYTASGVSTPTISGITNVSSSTAYDQHYIRVGNEVTVKGKFLLSPTANGLTVVRISFPTSPDPTDGTDSAVGSASGIGIAHGNINMHVSSSSAELSMNATTTISNEVYYQFTYTAL